MPFAGIPATIDNDIPGTNYCLGVDTALNIIQRSIDSIRDTALSFRRAFVIETMGRDCGYLAMVSALTAGAEICLVPEIEYDLDSIGGRLQHEIANGRRYMIAIVAEGTKMGEYLTRWIGETLKVDARLTVLGHVQRGGSPSVYDRLMAYKFAVAAIDALRDGATGDIMVYRRGSYERRAIGEVADAKHAVEPEIVDMCRPMCR
jgi:6-phosphofructokinase 1